MLTKAFLLYANPDCLGISFFSDRRYHQYLPDCLGISFFFDRRCHHQHLRKPPRHGTIPGLRHSSSSHQSRMQKHWKLLPFRPRRIINQEFLSRLIVTTPENRIKLMTATTGVSTGRRLSKGVRTHAATISVRTRAARPRRRSRDHWMDM